MQSRYSPARHVAAIAAAIACASAMAMPRTVQDIETMTSAELRTAYLACDRITAEGRADVDLFSTCAIVGEVLMHRDFGGSLELQLQWWREARESFAPAVGLLDGMLTRP